MKKISWSCIAIGLISIGLSILNAAGTFLPLNALNDLVRCILPYQSVMISLFAISQIVPQSRIFIDTLLSPFISYILSIILAVSGIGVIWVKPWGKTFVYIYVINMIFIVTIGILAIFPKGLIELNITGKQGSLAQFVIGGGLIVSFLILICALLYPIILLIFFSRPKIKEKFAVRR